MASYNIGPNKTLIVDGQEQSFIKLDLQPGVHWFSQEVLDPVAKKKVNKNRLTASAYDSIASVLGISVTMAEHTIGEDGGKRANPHIVQRNGIIESVLVRVYAVGRGPAGLIRCVDITLLHSPYANFCSDLYEKWLDVRYTGNDARPNPQAWGKMVSSETPLMPGYMRLPVGGIPGVCLEVEAMNPAVLMTIRDQKNASMFAERAAYSMATRAAIGKLIGVRYAEDDGSLTLPLWQPCNLTREQIAEVAKSETVERETIEAGTDEREGVDDLVDNASQAEPLKDKPKHNIDGVKAEIRAALKMFEKPATNPDVKKAVAAVGAKSFNELRDSQDAEQLGKFLNLLVTCKGTSLGEKE